MGTKSFFVVFPAVLTRFVSKGEWTKANATGQRSQSLTSQVFVEQMMHKVLSQVITKISRVVRCHLPFNLNTLKQNLFFHYPPDR